MEIDVLVKAPAAFARTAGLSTPTLDLIAALAIQKARDKGLYSALNSGELINPGRERIEHSASASSLVRPDFFSTAKE